MGRGTMRFTHETVVRYIEYATLPGCGLVATMRRYYRRAATPLRVLLPDAEYRGAVLLVEETRGGKAAILKRLARYSGFDSLKEWIEAAKEIHYAVVPYYVFLLAVSPTGRVALGDVYSAVKPLPRSVLALSVSQIFGEASENSKRRLAVPVSVAAWVLLSSRFDSYTWPRFWYDEETDMFVVGLSGERDSEVRKMIRAAGEAVEEMGWSDTVFFVARLKGQRRWRKRWV